MGLCFFVQNPRTAQADPLADAQSALNQAEAQLSSISAEYNELYKQAAELEEQISLITQNVLAAQEEMIRGQEQLGTTMVASYKNGGTSLINIFLASESLDSFLKSVEYYAAIQEDQAEKIQEQKVLKEKFDSELAELDTARDQQQVLLDQVSQKQQQAAAVVAEASAKVQNIESEQARLAALQEEANKIQNPAPDKNPNNDPDADSSSSAGNGNSGSSGNGNSGSSSGGSGSSGSGNSGSSGGSTSSGWKTGTASAYGGSSDPTAPVGSHTATGAVVTDSSMGVAVPMAWPSYRSYFGRAVEISYGGKTVVATVNDCGYMGGGSRALDLQPGVFKSFGYSTCQAWGLRTVSYRFL
ncbi:MAG: coiled-coil domain-containing protein [Anaerotardibacter sp.]